MTPKELKETLTAEQTEQLRTVCTKADGLTAADAEAFEAFITGIAAPALGEDQVAEPFRYITASAGGLRLKDLTALVGEEDFSAETFAELNKCLGFNLFAEQQLPKSTTDGAGDADVVYTLHPQLRGLLQQRMSAAERKSCACDIGYYLLEHCAAGDPVRDAQTLILLYVAEEPVAAAEYVSEAQGAALQGAILTTGNLLRNAPEAVRETVWQMLSAEGERVNHARLLSIMANDAVGALGKPDVVRQHALRLEATVRQMLPEHPELALYLGIARLRVAQAYRLERQEQEAQQWFGQGMGHVLAQVEGTPLPIAMTRVSEVWNALKVCQDMAQPKGMDAIFQKLADAERRSIAALLNAPAEGAPETHAEPTPEAEAQAESLMDAMIMQHVDMSRVRAAMPTEMQEQMTDYTEAAIQLLNTYLEGTKPEAPEGTKPETAAAQRRAGYYQTLGELYRRAGRDQESYEALTEAQILQLHIVGDLQRADGEAKMSQAQLTARLALSVTNHLLADHYRRQGRGQHDLNIVLTNNLDLAMACINAYPRDGRVIHFLINAALELGDMQREGRGTLAACGTYERALRLVQPHLPHLRMDQQLAVDVAMIHTRAGQLQADTALRRYKDAARNLGIAHQLWTSLAEHTKRPEFQKNAEQVAQLLKRVKK